MHAPRVTYYHGGAERYILSLLIELSRKNYPVSLLTYDAPQKTEWFMDFVNKFKGKIYLLKSTKMDNNFIKFQNATTPSLWDQESKIFGNDAKQFYQKNKISVIICHYAVDCLYLPTNVPIFLHLHGLPGKKRNKENLAIRRPEKIIAVSNYVASGWKRLHKINNKMFVVPNGIFLNNRGVNCKKKNDIIYAGRLIKIKGVDVLLQALSKLQNENLFLSTLIIGDGPEKNNLINLATKLKLKNIAFVGKIDDSTMFRHLSSTKISIFPSYKREGIMTSLLEASNCGAAIIASDSCSNREFVVPYINGLLFDEKNFKKLADCIKLAFMDECLRKKMIINSFETLKKFTWENQVKKLSDIYFSTFSKLS